MATKNLVLQLGHLTRDPELSYTPNQTAVVEFGLAVNEKWTGGDGQRHESVCYIQVRAYGALAENCNKYLSKGSLVLVQGRLAYEKWQDKETRTKHSMHRLMAQDVQFLSNGQKSREPGEDPVDGSDIPF